MREDRRSSSQFRRSCEHVSAGQAAHIETVTLRPRFVNVQNLEDRTQEVKPVTEPSRPRSEGAEPPKSRTIKGAALFQSSVASGSTLLAGWVGNSSRRRKHHQNLVSVHGLA